MNATANEPTNDGIEDQPVRTFIEAKPTEDGQWKATEPNADSDLWGRGNNPLEAVQHYTQLLMDSHE